MAWYRLKVDWTYSTSASANTAQSALNTALSTAGRAETVTRSGNQVSIILEPLTAQEAMTLRAELLTAWNTGTRTAGKASVVLRDESSS
jgi:uncharacterized protein (DUF362 family)